MYPREVYPGIPMALGSTGLYWAVLGWNSLKSFSTIFFSSGYPLPLHFCFFSLDVLFWLLFFFAVPFFIFLFDWSLSVLLSVCIFLFNFFTYPFFILEAFFFYTFLADGFAPLSSLFLFLPFSLSLLLFLKILGTSDTCRIPSLIIWLINLYHLFILTFGNLELP